MTTEPSQPMSTAMWWTSTKAAGRSATLIQRWTNYTSVAVATTQPASISKAASTTYAFGMWLDHKMKYVPRSIRHPPVQRLAWLPTTALTNREPRSQTIPVKETMASWAVERPLPSRLDPPTRSVKTQRWSFRLPTVCWRTMRIPMVIRSPSRRSTASAAT